MITNRGKKGMRAILAVFGLFLVAALPLAAQSVQVTLLHVNDTGAGQVGLVDYALLGADAETPSAPAVLEGVNALKDKVSARYGDVYHQTLAWAGQDITLDWKSNGAKRDTPLGNLLTDAYRAWTGSDIALEPYAYIGDALPAGAIVGADLFRAMSYGNLADVDGKQIARPWRLVTFRATGQALVHLLDTTLTLGGDYFPQVSGLRLDYDSSAIEPYENDPLGTRHKVLVDTVHVGGHKLVGDQLYRVTVTEGIHNDLLGIFYLLGLNMQDVETLPTMAFEAVRDLAMRRGELGLATSNRIRDVAALPRAEKAESRRGSASPRATLKIR